MPSDKFARAPLWCALSLALGLAVTSPLALAAGLGRLTVHSGLGQPLRAELEVTAVGRDEVPTLQVRLAPAASFRAANLEFNPALTNLRFVLDRRPDGNYYVQIASPQPVNEPYLDLMVELTWSTGRVIREYTVLLDPPSLRAEAPVVAPVAPPAAAPAASAVPPVATPTPRPLTATPPAAVAAAPAPASAAAPGAEGTYTVKSGDTLGRIALANKPGSVSLEQMLVAMLRANPSAFVSNNMNRLRAGATLTIPSEAEAAATEATVARRQVIAQSADFAQYKSRLAQAAGAAPAVAAAPAAAAAAGRVTTQVEDRSAAATQGGDQLKIARAEDKGTGAAVARADEAASKARALQEEQERLAQLQRTNEAIQRALQIQSKAGAQVQKQAEGATTPAAVTPATTVAPAPQAAAPAAEPMKAEPAPAAAPSEPAAQAPTPPVAAPAPAPKAAAPAPQPESNFFLEQLSNQSTQYSLAAILALLAGLFGWSWYRKRRVESNERFKESGEGLQANSLFGATGGQSVDTGHSTFNSSFIPAASQLDSNEVDPVAEADVYIAYGREEQAEDILKEAIRLQPDRQAVRVKLMEIYARRGDKAAFMAVAEDLKTRTGGVGEDWERAVKLGRTVDPAHALFVGASNAELARGPTTGFRLDPPSRTGRPSTLGGGPTAGLDLTGLTANSSMSAAGSVPPLTKMVVDTRMSDSVMSSDTKMPADTKMSGPATTSAPTTQFRATLSADEPKTIAPLTGDFGSLDFDLGPTKMNLGPPTKMPSSESATRDTDFFASTTPLASDFDEGFSDKLPAMAPTATGAGIIPDLDLNLPSTRMPVAPAPTPMMEEALSRPTVIGAMRQQPALNTVGGLPEDQAARLTANTDQATVPLIDFDLSAVSLDAATKRGETEPGSALAQQMATKLDLARGYIDLGVKDGARELLDEVMRDGTREQRQDAIELIKQIES
jgi:pilus assembly protein FimV